MVVINCLGEMCPIPVIKINEALKTLKAGESVKVITDHSCVAQSILDHFKRDKYSVQSDEVMNGIWEMTITKN